MASMTTSFGTLFSLLSMLIAVMNSLFIDPAPGRAGRRIVAPQTWNAARIPAIKKWVDTHFRYTSLHDGLYHLASNRDNDARGRGSPGPPGEKRPTRRQATARWPSAPARLRPRRQRGRGARGSGR